MPALSRTRTILATAVMAIGVAGGAAFATAATSDSSPSSAAEPAATATADQATATPAAPAAPADGAPAPPDGAAPPAGLPDPASLPNGPGEELLTGETAEQVTAAALAAQPGATVIRVETDSGGAAFEAHVQLADGSYATILLDEGLAVTGTEEGFGPGPAGGPMGQPGPAPDADQGAQSDAGSAPATTATA
ncbi:MAG: hypothetical protein R3C15_17580 [Thermoleophilia bacterium]